MLFNKWMIRAISLVVGFLWAYTLVLTVSPPVQKRGVYLCTLFIGLGVGHALNACLSGTLFQRFKDLSSRKKGSVWLFVLGMTVWLWESIKGVPNQTFPPFVSGLVLLGSWLGIAVVLLWLIGAFLEWRGTDRDGRVSRGWVLLFALPFWVMGLLYWLAFYPAILTHDSLSHWTQAHTHHFSDWHPVSYTWLIMALTSFWDSPAPVALFQIIVMGLILGYAGYSLAKASVPKWLIGVSGLILALFPAFGIYDSTLWKDILYSGGLVLFSVFLFNSWQTRGEWLASWWHQGLMFLTASLVCLFRNNGLPIVLVVFLLLMIVYRTHFKKMGVTALLTLGLFWLINGPVFDVLDVKRPDPNEALGIPQQQVAAVIAQDGKLTSSQRAYFTSILPLKDWKALYNPYLADPIKNAPDFNKAVILSDKTRFLENWFSLCVENPRLVVTAYLKQTSLIWQIREPKRGYTFMYATYIEKNSYGLKFEKPAPALQNGLFHFLKWTTQYKVIFWRPAVELALLLVAAFVVFLKNDGRALLISLPVLLNTGTLLVGMPAQDYRYLYPETLLVPFLVLCLFSASRKGEQE